MQSNPENGKSDPDGNGLAAPSSGLRGALKILIPVGISAGLVAWVLYSIEDPAAVWEHMGQVAWLPLLAIIPVSLFSHVLRAWRWRRFIGQPVSLTYSFTSVMIGYAVNTVLPRGGEVARVINMNRLTRVPIARLVTTLLAERLLDVIALVGCLGLAFLIEGELIASQFPKLSAAGPLALLFAVVGLGGLFAVALFPGPMARVFGKFTGLMHRRLGAKIELMIQQGAEGLAFLKRPSQALPALIETILIWWLYWVVFVLGLHACGLLAATGYDGGTVCFSIASAGVLIPTMGAIGSYHEFGRQALEQLYQVDEEQAVAAITIIHAVIFLFVGGVCGALSWGLQGWAQRREVAALAG